MTEHQWGEWTTSGGKRVNWGLRYQLEAMDKMVAHPSNGGEREPMTRIQGCGANRVGASGTTHGGTGAIDLSAFNSKNRVRVGRLVGLCIWYREDSAAWDPHHHGITDGDGGVSASAAGQVKEYHNRGDGLVGNRPDNGYKMLVFPLFVFPEKAVGKPGRCWATSAGVAYEQPTPLSKPRGLALKKGQFFDVVAVVRVGSSYWGINAAAQCFPMSKLTRTKPSDTPAPVPSQKKPAQIIDLTNAKVTMPYGEPEHPTEIKQPALAGFQHKDFFYVDAKGRVIFMAPTNGVSTEGSEFSRSEVREMANKGKDRAEWDSWRGKNIMNLRQAILERPSGKPDVVAGQVHDGDDDVAMCRLEGNDLFVEHDGDNIGWLDPNYNLGDMFDLTFMFTASGLSVAYKNLVTGRAISHLLLKGKKFSDCYWKFGCYTQASSLVAKSNKKYGTGRGKVAVERAQMLHAA